MGKIRTFLLALAAGAPLVFPAPAGALGTADGAPSPLPPSGEPPLEVPLPDDGSPTAPLPPTGTDPSAALVQVVADIAALVGVPLPVPPPSGDPGSAPLPPVYDALPADACRDLTGPVTEAGAPVAASCTVRPTDNGGVDVEVCLTVATIATCDAPSSPSPSPTTTPTTTPTAPGNDGGSGNGSGNASGNSSSSGSGATRSNDAGNTGGPSDDGQVGTASATLPFTGGSVGALLALGTALATSGGLATRAVRRRRG